MEEKIIIKSELFNIKMVRNIIWAVGAVIAVLVSFTIGSFVDGTIAILIICLIVVAVIGIVFYLWCSGYELTVTDKRVYGKIRFGKRVDLPFDMISAVGTSMFSGISINTASGAIAFLMIKNRDSIHNELSKLLIDRQGKPNVMPTQVMQQSNAEELKKYKDLLDSGVLTQEEFDAKKKQILGI
jgi:preprotein translocase subunit SecY